MDVSLVVDTKRLVDMREGEKLVRRDARKLRRRGLDIRREGISQLQNRRIQDAQ